MMSRNLIAKLHMARKSGEIGFKAANFAACRNVSSDLGLMQSAAAMIGGINRPEA
jgi:hypothetical protein